jgi:hypothetical protein
MIHATALQKRRVLGMRKRERLRERSPRSGSRQVPSTPSQIADTNAIGVKSTSRRADKTTSKTTRDPKTWANYAPPRTSQASQSDIDLNVSHAGLCARATSDCLSFAVEPGLERPQDGSARDRIVCSIRRASCCTHSHRELQPTRTRNPECVNPRSSVRATKTRLAGRIGQTAAPLHPGRREVIG